MSQVEASDTNVTAAFANTPAETTATDAANVEEQAPAPAEPALKDLTVMPFWTGFIQGFVSVGMKYRKEKRAARKALQEREAMKSQADLK